MRRPRAGGMVLVVVVVLALLTCLQVNGRPLLGPRGLDVQGLQQLVGSGR